MTVTAKGLRNQISSLCTHVLFDYHGKACGVDPFSENDFDMWHGDDHMKARNIDEVMESPFFDGKALKDIVSEIENLDM